MKIKVIIETNNRILRTDREIPETEISKLKGKKNKQYPRHIFLYAIDSIVEEVFIKLKKSFDGNLTEDQQSKRDEHNRNVCRRIEQKIRGK